MWFKTDLYCELCGSSPQRLVHSVAWECQELEWIVSGCKISFTNGFIGMPVKAGEKSNNK